ncbi:MAG: hypothetical protein ACREOQ_13475 [Gemmatimonadales bacterium]|jgi:hypothetical protein
MRAVVGAARQVWGLFVEDASFTAGILGCVAFAVFVLPHTGLRPVWRGPALFVGLGGVLLENVVRSARRR